MGCDRALEPQVTSAVTVAGPIGVQTPSPGSTSFIAFERPDAILTWQVPAKQPPLGLWKDAMVAGAAFIAAEA